MEIYCKLSGVSFNVAYELASGEQSTTKKSRYQQSFAKAKIIGIHPLFYARHELLKQQFEQLWARGKLNENDSRVLFLAFLRETQLIEWRATATPAPSTVARYMEQVVKFADWIVNHENSIIRDESRSRFALKLPQFVINHEGRELKEIDVWISTWWSAKEDWYSDQAMAEWKRVLRDKEEKLTKSILSVYKDVHSYASPLAEWALEATHVPPTDPFYETWKAIFRLTEKSVDLFNGKYRTCDIEDLVEHMAGNLPHGTVVAAKVLSHLRKLLAYHKAGLNYFLGFAEEDEFTFEDPLEAEKNSFQIVDDVVSKAVGASSEAGGNEAHTQNVNIQRAIDTYLVGNEVPQQKDFPNRFAWLKAKGAYDLAVAQQQKRLQRAKDAADREKQLDLDLSHDAEEASVEEVVDVSKLLSGKE